MSRELALECDRLVDATSILSRNFGIPKWSSNESSTLPLTASEQQVQALESEYVQLHQQLTTKTNKLLYLNRLNELEEESEEMITEKYDNVIQNLPLVDPSQLEQFLILHNQALKTEIFLNGTLQKTIPILRSIHQADSDLTSSELNLLTNLEKLYKPSGITYELMNKFRKQHETSSEIAEKYSQLNKAITQDVKPEIITLQGLNDRLNTKSSVLVKEKQNLIDDELTSATGKERRQISELFHDLVSRWDSLTKLCDLIPSLITGLPINWYDDKDLFAIIKDCERLSERLTKLQSIISVGTFQSFSTGDLISLDFSELEEV